MDGGHLALLRYPKIAKLPLTTITVLYKPASSADDYNPGTQLSALD